MSLWNEDLVRAEHSSRVAEAQQRGAEVRIARARRLSRRAERAAQKARVALARAL